MHIEKYLSRNRRDFHAVYRCEHCDATVEKSGYDDTYFHHNVIPDMVCDGCRKKASDDYTPNQTRYAEGEVI